MKKESTIIGIVKEFDDSSKSSGVGIATDDGIFLVKMNAEGKNLQYEIGNKVEVTGIITKTKDGARIISVTNYEIYEPEDDNPDDFDYNVDFDYRDEY